MIKVDRMFRCSILDGGSGDSRGTVTVVRDDDPAKDVVMWCPDSGSMIDFFPSKDGPVIIDDKTVSVGGRKWKIHRELPVTADKIVVNVVSGCVAVTAR